MLNAFRALKDALFPSEERLKYDLVKTAVDLARLTSEIKGCIAVLESDFSEQESRTFEYAQMEPENRFVTEVLRQKKLFMEKYERCRVLLHHRPEYRRERDETIKCGQDLLKEIEVTCNKLPSSVGFGEL